MSKLTTKQEKFAQGVAKGMTQADAYRNSYSSGKMKDKTIWEHSSHLMAEKKISARVDQLKAKLAEKELWTREESVRTLRTVIEEGESKAGDRINATKELNSMHGFNAPQKHEHEYSGGVNFNIKFGDA